MIHPSPGRRRDPSGRCGVHRCAWQRGVGGATTTLAAPLAFHVVELSMNQRPAAGAFPLFAVPALLYPLGARLRHVQVPPDPAT